MNRLPKQFEVHLPGCFIAGGAVLSVATKTDINDYDVYPKSNKDMVEALHCLLDDNCYVVNITDRAVTFKSNSIVGMNDERATIQVMTYDTFETAEKIFENFDFTVCMGAYDCDTKTYTFHEDFYPDIATKTLRFNPKTRYPLNSLLRVNKYVSKGFFIGKPEMIRMILTAIEKGMPTSWEELESQIGGTYGREVKLARGDTPFSVQAALDLLSNINDFTPFEGLGAEDYSSKTAEDLEDMFSEELKHVVVNSEGDYFIVDMETATPTRALGDIKPKNCVVLNESDDLKSKLRFTGYKILREMDNGKYGPGVQTYSKLEYAVGEETTCASHPYLYVFPTYEAAKYHWSYSSNKGRQMFHVTYNPLDLKQVSSKEIQVTNLRVAAPVTDIV